MVPRKIEKYGWRRDSLDPRDWVFEPSSAVSIPETVDLSSHMPSIYDQGQLGSCTGNGIARVMEYQEGVQSEGSGTPSRLFIYYNERVIEGTVSSDSGAEIRDGIKVVASQGAPSETDWPYDINKFADKPPQRAYDDAKKYEAIEYRKILVGSAGSPMRSAIAARNPIVFGFTVPSYFETSSEWDPTSTPLPLPAADDQSLGGHCVVVTGYDFSCTKFKVPAFQCDNSWGPDWGIGGRFWMDYRWFDPSRQLTDDLWVVTKVS